MTSPFLTRVTLYNYKNIAYCSVPLGKLSFLVGPNGSGKSNFLEALDLLSNAVRSSLDSSLTTRNGLSNLLPNIAGSEPKLGIRLDFLLPSGPIGHYAVVLSSTAGGGYQVDREECFVESEDPNNYPQYFIFANGQVKSNLAPPWLPPSVGRRRLLLGINTSLPYPIDHVAGSIAKMRVYNIVPDRFRTPESMPWGGGMLDPDGRNLTAVFQRLASSHPEVVQRIEDYLTHIVPNIDSVRSRQIGDSRFLEFPSNGASTHPLDASLMSSGTLRALGILVALFQRPENESESLSVIGLEEPETALHPGAFGVLLDALEEASDSVQVLLTSHSPDLLDDKRLAPASIISFDLERGVARIGRIDDVGAEAIRDQLVTAGELLRVNQVRPHDSAQQPPIESLFGA